MRDKRLDGKPDKGARHTRGHDDHLHQPQGGGPQRQCRHGHESQRHHAAEQNDPHAQVCLGAMYCNGAEQNFAEAMKWYRKAAEQGYVKAQEILTKRGINWMNA